MRSTGRQWYLERHTKYFLDRVYLTSRDNLAAWLTSIPGLVFLPILLVIYNTVVRCRGHTLYLGVFRR